MPSTFGTGVGKGYAFLNFSSWEGLQAFARACHGKRFFHIGRTGVPLSVSKASVQGREPNVKKWDAPRLQRVRNPALKPIVPHDAACNVVEEFERRCRDFEQSRRERRSFASAAGAGASGGTSGTGGRFTDDRERTRDDR